VSESAGLRPPRDLVERCRRGDQDAWRELVEHHSRYVYAIIVRGYRLPESEAEDVFQDVFGRVFERLDTLRDDAALLAWIGRLTRSLCIDHLRRTRDTQELTEELGGVVHDELDQLEQALDVRRALEGLSDGCRDILDRFFCREQPYAVISAELDIPAGTIASRISRCLERLRSSMEGSEPSPRPSRGP
jgi:RNA polymerase sigma-70 factor, ECF subfamily